jgi:translation initiation factor IF-1
MIVTLTTGDQVEVQDVVDRLYPGDRIRVLCDDGYLEAEKLENGEFVLIRKAAIPERIQ